MSEPPKAVADTFCKAWIAIPTDNNLTLHGFYRFKTTHLLNLCFLENEIAEMDRISYQASLSLDLRHSSTNRLGLKHYKKDADSPKVDDIINDDSVLKLHLTLKQYDEVLVTFNSIMSMETFSLLDDEQQSSLRDDLCLREIHKTRLFRVDLGTRA